MTGLVSDATTLTGRAQLVFEVITAVLTVSNALDQPYRERVEIMQRLKRDGILSFLVRPGYTGLVSCDIS